MNSITDNWTDTPAPLTQGRPHRYCLILKVITEVVPPLDLFKVVYWSMISGVA